MMVQPGFDPGADQARREHRRPSALPGRDPSSRVARRQGRVARTAGWRRTIGYRPGGGGGRMRLPLDDSPYVVGIDLGTTNSALAQGPGDPEDTGRVEVRSLAQLVNAGEVAERPLLPSFLYLPADVDFPAGSHRPAVGPVPVADRRRAGAARVASEVPDAGGRVGQVVAVLRGGEPHRRRSCPGRPRTTCRSCRRWRRRPRSSRTLRHAWDHRRPPGVSLAEQDVVLTVPASFDEEARELTRRAAADGGPRTADAARGAAGRVLRVAREPAATRGASTCASATSCSSATSAAAPRDFTPDRRVRGGRRPATRARRRRRPHPARRRQHGPRARTPCSSSGSSRRGHRIDTLAAAGAVAPVPRREGAPVPGPRTPQPARSTIRGRGTRLVGGTITTRNCAARTSTEVLVDGFFPIVPGDAMPARQRRVGFQELGLAYAADPAVTRHLARFLNHQARQSPTGADIRRGRSGMACPTHVLFNGGVMKAAALRERHGRGARTAGSQAEGFEPLGRGGVLDAPDLDLAVARGAAYYGQRAARPRRPHPRRRAAHATTSASRARCPRCPACRRRSRRCASSRSGWRRGPRPTIPQREFGLVVGEPAEFRFLSLHRPQERRARKPDRGLGRRPRGIEPARGDAGASRARSDAVVPVRLESRVTEVGHPRAVVRLARRQRTAGSSS